MPLNSNLQEPFRTVDIEEKPTDKRQYLEFQRTKLRVNHRDLLSHNLAAAKAKHDNDLASTISDHLTELDVKIWEERVAYNPQRTPSVKTGSKFSRARGGHSITRFTPKRQIQQPAGASPKSTAVALRLRRRRAILRAAAKFTASYDRASAKRERRARPQVRKRAFMALYIAFNGLLGLAMAGMRQRSYTGKLCEVGDWRWVPEAVGYRFTGWMYKC